VQDRRLRGKVLATNVDPRKLTPSEYADLIYFCIVENGSREEIAAFDARLNLPPRGKRERFSRAGLRAMVGR